MIVESFMQVLFAALLSNMPKDTRNTMTQSRMVGAQDVGTHYKITITGPYATNPRYEGAGRVGDYAYNVNYNQRRSALEVANYKYIERNITQQAKVFGWVIK